jgi:hypothetical protein
VWKWRKSWLLSLTRGLMEGYETRLGAPSANSLKIKVNLHILAWEPYSKIALNKGNLDVGAARILGPRG